MMTNSEEEIVESDEIEDAVDSVSTDYTCLQTSDYTQTNEHGDTSFYAQCTCPLYDCNFICSVDQLSLHFSSKHWDSGRRFRYNTPLPISVGTKENFIVLQAEEDGVLFLLNRGTESVGHSIRITCIAPSTSKERFLYDVVSERGTSSLRLKSCTQNFPGRVESFSQVDFLVVPFGYCNSSGQLNLEVCIWSSKDVGID